jgi:hypothetical protein
MSSREGFQVPPSPKPLHLNLGQLLKPTIKWWWPPYSWGPKDKPSHQGESAWTAVTDTGSGWSVEAGMGLWESKERTQGPRSNRDPALPLMPIRSDDLESLDR